jgi:hypothetical protein
MNADLYERLVLSLATYHVMRIMCGARPSVRAA